MNSVTIIYAALCALAFVFWPLIGKYTGASGAWIATAALIGTSVVVIPLSGRALAAIPSFTTLWLLVAAGAVNGFGFYFYALKVSDPGISSGSFVVITSVMMVVWAPILDGILNGASFNASKIIGYGVAALAIYLLGR